MSINPATGPVPGPADPPYPATSPAAARRAARARVRRLRQGGSTYSGIASDQFNMATLTARNEVYPALAKLFHKEQPA